MVREIDELVRKLILNEYVTLSEESASTSKNAFTKVFQILRNHVNTVTEQVGELTEVTIMYSYKIIFVNTTCQRLASFSTKND